MKPLSISGVAHRFSETTKRKYKEKYSNINPQTVDEGKGLDALIINHLIGVDLFSEDVTRAARGQEEARNDIEIVGEMEQVDSVNSDESSHLVTAAP